MSRGGAVVLTCALVALPTLPAAGQAGGAEEAEPRAFVTRHAGTFNGRTVRYTARVAETLIADDEGRPAASIFSTAYLADDVAAADRPVVFLFNGGPGAPSVLLHMGAFGPFRAVVPSDVTAAVEEPYRLVANPYTVLDVADLVFIDPVGTGYSRPLPGVDPDRFRGVRNDARAVARFVEAWSAQHGREPSPKYVLGESYGTIRAVAMLDEFEPGTRIDGVILFGQAVNIVETVQRAGNIVGQAVNLPTLALIAAYHDRSDLAGLPAEAIVAEVYGFAMGDYLTALAQGADLPETERRRIATELERVTGITASYWLEHDLMMSKVEFRRTLLRERGLIVGMYDARYSGPAPAPGEPAADPFMPVIQPHGALIAGYLEDSLGVDLPREYTLRDTGARGWDYGRPPSPFSDYDWSSIIASRMAEQHGFRLMVGTGLYDTTTTVGPALYLIARGGFPPDRVMNRTYPAGHMAYTDERALRSFTDDVRAFITGRY